jgi:hypothetical protein
MPPGEAPILTGRTESQGLGITEADVPALAPRGASAAPLLTQNGAHMGRGMLPVSDRVATALGHLGRQVADAVVEGDFERARELTEAAIQLRATDLPKPQEDS